MGADNQQERPSARARREGEALDANAIPAETGWYLAGFADGEGSFNISFRPRTDYASPWKISLCFNISPRDPTVLRIFRDILSAGTLRQRKDGVWYFEVNDLKEIVATVMPFFDRFRLISAKKRRDFTKFKEIAQLLQCGEHRSNAGVRAILEIRREMNDGGKRRYAESEILRRLELAASSETVRRTL